MMKKYENLKEQYPEYVSLDQFFRICRIAKRSALYLIQHDIVPAIDTGRRTWRYKIAIDDVITYLRRREQLGSMIPAGAVSSRPKSNSAKSRKSFSDFIRPGMESRVAEYFAFVYAEYPDVLTIGDIVEMTGISSRTIAKWIQSGEVKALRVGTRYIIPKEYLLTFMTTPRFFNAKSNSQSFKKVLGGFEIWQSSLPGVHKGGER